MKFKFASALVLACGFVALPPLAGAVPPPPRVNPLAAQQKAVRDADQKVVEARRALLAIRKKVETSFSSKPDYKAAKAAVDKSKADYEAELLKANASLQNNPEYKALAAKRDKAQALIDQSRQTPVPGPNGEDPVKISDDEIATAGQNHQDAVLAMKDMEKKAQENDPNIATLLQKRNEAQSAWDAIQAQVDEALKTDPAYAPAQQALDQAETQDKQAHEQLAQASKAQRDAAAAAAKAKATSGAR